MSDIKWEIIGKCEKQAAESQTVDIVKVLLKNRGIATEREKKEFFEPTNPYKLTLDQVGIDVGQMAVAVERIKKARRRKEEVVVYGDYDADGITATAVAWEALYGMGVKAVPYVPERFSEGYGINTESIKKIKSEHENLGVIVTVDNGIVANEAVDYARKSGIDVIVTDHHQPGEKVPNANAIVHTTEISGSAVAWMFARELGYKRGLDLVAIGSIADQMRLVGVNRSFVKHGLVDLNKTDRPGILAMFNESGIEPRSVNNYHIGFVIAPRINAMGRLKHGLDSLRLLCTSKNDRAMELARYLGETNLERQRIVEEAVNIARDSVSDNMSVIVISHKDYHEGVIGLVASSLVEEYYRPAIVISRGEIISKASARSVPGFNIIEMIRRLDNLIVEGGGHPMAAGFTIETKNISRFEREMQSISGEVLTDEILSKKINIDMELEFNQINWDLVDYIDRFEPTGLGNPSPLFFGRGLGVSGVRSVGSDGKHIKLKLSSLGREYDAIGFGLGHLYAKVSKTKSVDVAFNLDRNVWNGTESIQLKIKDIKFGDGKFGGLDEA